MLLLACTLYNNATTYKTRMEGTGQGLTSVQVGVPRSLLLELCLHGLGHPVGLGLGDLLDDVVHLETQALDLLVPCREGFSCCAYNNKANVKKT